MKRLLVLAIFGVLGGCSSATVTDMGTAKPIHYECDAGRNFDITFNNDDALLTLAKEEYLLKNAVTASGMRYVSSELIEDSGTAVEFLGKGYEATLELGPVVFNNCVVVK
ncbi:MliC family protein [Aliivibrio sp. S3MY1]|uniref:MliC family protein n=1 Tax=unclassified Aliivibrio TaxID=2645654 RepID=UPI0023790985|nr:MULTISPECIES: MliC family protein [unclassified Aliivibrio]MDD9196075.1 MliC family protein [Aliivibrio sp. S3MY1]MDD9199258.1 MliC family protein [Aliivibrio sp. S2MY1]